MDELDILLRLPFGTSPTQGLYLHREAQHRKTPTNIHVFIEIRTHDLNIQVAKTHAVNCAAAVI
jgi:hypothetical protein